MRRALWWGLGALAFAVGLSAVLWPGKWARAFIAPQPTVTIRTVSDDVEKTTTSVLGAPPVPIDVNGDRLPDVDVGVELTRVEHVPEHPLSPTITVKRDPLSLNDPTALLAKRSSPPLQVEVFISTFELETQKTDTLSFGYDTAPGGSIPASFTASLLGNIELDSPDPAEIAANFIDPLRAEVSTPGYNGPLRLFSNIDAEALVDLLANVSLGYDPLPERLGVTLEDTGEGTKIRYEQSSMIPEVDLDARAHLERAAGVTDVATLIQRLPAVIEGELKNTAVGGSFTYRAQAPTDPPDISLRFRSVPAQGDPIDVVAEVAGLPSEINATWPVEGGSAQKVSFDAPDPVGSVGFEVRNFLEDTDAPDLPPPLKLPPRDHVQFVSRGLGDDALWAARGHVSGIRAVSYEQGANLTKVIHAQLGDGAHPLGAGIDVETATGRLLVESTVTNLPADLTVTFRPQDDTNPETLPLLFAYHASAETDVVSHVEIANSLGIGCRERGSTCLDATVRHVPENLEATFSSVPDVGGKLRVSAVPRPGGAQPDIVAGLVMAPADVTKDPIDVHAHIQRFPQKLVSTYHLTNKQPDLVDLHSCEWDGSACTDGAPPGIGQVNFRYRNFLDGGFGTDELTPTNYVSVVSRKLPDRFEVSGQTTEIRHVVYRKAGQVGGVHVEMGKGEPFRVHADIDTPDDSPPQQQIADSVIGSLPNLFNICFRSPSDDAVAPVADATGVTNECQTDQAFGATVESTPFTVIYDATGATTPNPAVEARAKILFGGSNPVDQGERQNPSDTITIKTRIENLPTKIRADYQPDKDLGQDVAGRPLKVSYEANDVVGHVTLDLAQRKGTSQCEDPRAGKESLCANVDIRLLPTLLRATITNTPSKTAPKTDFLFQAGTPEQAEAMRMGCTGLLSCKGFDPGLHLVKVKNAPVLCIPPNCGGTKPQVINASVEGLPPYITGSMEQGIKKDPETGADSAAPALTKLDLQGCSGFFKGACIRDDIRAVRFAMEDFLVPDPIGDDPVPANLPSPPFAGGSPLGGEFFHFVKHGEDFRVSAALRGFQGATYAGPGDTTAVQVNTTNVARNLHTFFELVEESGSNISVGGVVQNLPKEIQFCFRGPRIVAFGPNPLDAGKFCDASNASADNAPPAPNKDLSDTRLRLFGDPSVAGKPNAQVDFSISGPGTSTTGAVTVVGLPAVMQATFGGDNVGFNKPDLPGFPLPASNTIDSIRFDIRKDFPADGTLPSDPPFSSVRHFPTEADHSLDEPALVPISNKFPSPYVSLVKNVARLHAKGIVNGIQETFMFNEPCVYPEGGAPDPVPLCKRLRAKTGVGVPSPQILAFYLSMLDGTDRTFLTADIGPLPNLIDARIDTEANFEPLAPNGTLKEKAELKTDRPPIIVLRTCEGTDCANVPPGTPSIRGVFETGTVKALERLSSVGFEDPLFQPGGPPGNPTLDASASINAYDLPVTDEFYDPNDAAAAQDLKDIANNNPPGAAAPNATAFRIVTMENGEKAVRGRLKMPFPGSLDVGAPIKLDYDDAPTDPYSGHAISDMTMSYKALGFGINPQPIDFGRAVVVVQDLQPGAFHGGESVIIASNLPGVGKIRMVSHKQKSLNQALLDVRGEFSSDLGRLEYRSWDARDETGALTRVTARGDVPVPNLRANIHNIPGGPEGWRARMYIQGTDDLDDRKNKDPCADTIIAVVFNFIPCVGSQYADFGLDFKPVLSGGANASPPARLIDGVVSTKAGNRVKLSGFATPDGGAPADFTARAAVRVDPLNINITIGVPGLAGAVFSLFSQLDVNFYSIGQNSFELAFKPPGHVELDRNDPPGDDGGHTVGGIDAGLYLRPVWDVDWLFGFGNVWWFVFFGIGPPIAPPPPTTLPMSGLDCGFGTLAGSFFTEFEYLGSEIFGSGSNGYTLSGSGDYDASLVLNAVTPAGVPIGDISGGLITRGLAALINTIFCAFSADDLPSGVPADPLSQFIDPGGVAPPAVPAAEPPPPPPPHVTIPVGPAVLLCGNHDYASLTVPAGATLRVSPTPILDVNGDPVIASGEQVAACLPKDVGKLRVTSKKIPGDPASGKVLVAAGGFVDANASMLTEPPVSVKFTTDPNNPVPVEDTGEPIPFSPPQGTPDQSSNPPKCGGGAGFGGTGGASACRPGPNNVGGTPYATSLVDPATDPATGEQLEVIYAGSKGADAGDPDILFGFKPSGGAGGGMISIEAHTAELAGTLRADGRTGQSGPAAAATCLAGSSAGGGSGGGVYVAAKRLTTVAGVTVSARGGNGGFGKAGGGGGGGGRVKLLGIIQAGPVVPVDVSGGAAPGPICDGIAPQPGAAGSILTPPNFRAGGAMSDATGAPGRVIDGYTTRWTNSNAINVTSSSAATAGGPWPFHETMLCFVKESANRNDASKKLPEELPLEVPEPFNGQPLGWYLHDLNCRFGDVHSLANGVETGTSFNLGAISEGYYGFFTVAARRITVGPGDFPFSPCFNSASFFFPPYNVVDTDCQYESVPKSPEFVLAVDRSKPTITKLEHFASPSALGQNFVPDGQAAQYTNANALVLRPEWTDGFNGVVISDQETNATTLNDCYSNDGFVTKTCWGIDDPVQPIEKAHRDFPLEIDWALTGGDGLKNVSLNVTDLAGNTSSASVKQMTVDTKAPDVIVTGNPPAPPPDGNGWYRTPPTASMALAGPDAGVGIDIPTTSKSGLFYVFDDTKATRQAYVNPVTMPEGKHTIYGVAVDRLGNVSKNPNSFLARVDTRKPLSAVTVVPRKTDGYNGWYVNKPFVGVRGVDIIGGSGVGKIRFRTGPSFPQLGPEQDYTGFFQVAEGTTLVCAKAIDKAGNVGAESCSPLIRVDSTVPVSPFSVAPPDGDHNWYLGTPSPSISTIEDGSGLGPAPLLDLDLPEAGLWVSIDRLPFFRAGDAFGTTVPEGNHDIRWFSEDAAGNRELIHRRDFHVDTSDPLSKLSSFPPSPNAADWYRSEPLVTLTASDGEENSGPLVENWGLDGPASSAYARRIPVSEGTHDLSFFAQDVAGRLENRRNEALRVDVRAPSADPLAVPGPLPVLSLLGASSTLGFTVDDDQPADVRAIVRIFDVTGKLVRDIDLGPRPQGAAAAVWDGKDNEGDRAIGGVYYFRVLTVDEAGNVGMSGESREFLVL